MAAKILLIEDDPSYASALRLMLSDYPFEITWAKTGTEGVQQYQKSTQSYATVIVDYRLPDLVGSEVARHLKKINPSQDILFASGYNDSEYLTEMLETGCARTFLPKGRSVEETRSKILDSISIFERKNKVLGSDDFCPSKAELALKSFGFVGRSRALYEVTEAVKKYRNLSGAVRIIGETGTGKEKVAKALIPEGKRSVVINCPEFASSESRLESELFGHMKGAFTGADENKPGLLLQAHGHVLLSRPKVS
jgi:DNA-binding NtrC family response regulator